MIEHGRAPSAMSGWRSVFEVSATTAMLIFAVIIIWQGFRSPRAASVSDSELVVPSDVVDISASTRIGHPLAKVALIEFSDFECPFCGRVADESIKHVIKDYVDTGRVIFVYKHLPLEFHKNANGAAVAAICADRQGRFMALHDLLFANPTKLAEPELMKLVAQSGVDLGPFMSCRNAAETVAQIEGDKAQAAKFGIKGTPAFFVGRVESPGKVRVVDALRGARPVEVYREALDRLLR